MRAAAEKFLKSLFLAEKTVTVIAFVVMAGALIADVVSRELRGQGLFGAPKVGVFAMVTVAFVGIGVASATGSHLRPRFADRLVPKSWDGMIDRIAEFLFAIFCLAFAALAVGVVQETYMLGEKSPTLRWPVWPFQAILVGAFVIAALRHTLFGIYPDLRPAPQSEADPEQIDQHHIDEKNPEKADTP